MSKTKKMQEERERTLEESFELLEGVVKRLESGTLSLEDSFTAYKQGMELLKECSEKVDLVEKKILQMDEKGELHEF